MIYALSNPPAYCPGCGYIMTAIWADKLNRNDFFAHAAHTCPSCGSRFFYANETQLAHFAQDIGSDLKRE